MADRGIDPPALVGFTFVKALGSGGFSDVFLYDQELPRRKVAVKVLLAEGLTAEGREAFVDEANLMARLSAHPYIVTIYHADVSRDGRPYFIMEYCSGPSLSERYKRQPLPVPETLRTGIRIASAVATAHEAGILHRDIKPANILTNDFGWPLLTDFGISSAILDDAPSQTVTRTSRATGGQAAEESRSVGLSIPWSPPEMFEDAPRPDVRTDVYSLAATIYTLLAGRTPFEVPGGRNQSLDLMGRIERGAITPMKREDVPRSLLVVLKKAMAVSPANRYPSAIEFARALQRVELELSYAPTNIEVPNLVVPEPERDAGSGEDETRARGVTTVAAQKVSPRSPTRPAFEARPVPGGPSPVLDATVVRGSVGSAVASGGEPTQEAGGPVAPRGSRRRPAAIVVGIVGVLVVGTAIAAAVLKQGTGIDDPGASPSVSQTYDPFGSESAAGPVNATWTATPADGGSTLVVAWTNPSPADGDSYLWQRIDGGGDGKRVPVPDPSADVGFVAGGGTVCLEIWTVRDSQLSVDSLRTCYP
jgi:serine/threonine protein kinase